MLGCHGDDIEIGCGGTVLTLLGSRSIDITWVVLAGADTRRAREAQSGAEAFLESARASRVIIGEFRDGFMPHEGARVKEFFEELTAVTEPDLIFTHRRHDLHQDHRLASDLTWQTFRSHTILEYEIPQWDGDMGAPNLYVPLSDAVAKKKIELLTDHFGSQQGKDWFDADVFRALMRLRAMECRAPDGVAEAFYGRKLTLDLT